MPAIHRTRPHPQAICECCGRYVAPTDWLVDGQCGRCLVQYSASVSL
jgi:hypothetical protein